MRIPVYIPLIIVGVVALLAAGCAADNDPDSASGRPEEKKDSPKPKTDSESAFKETINMTRFFVHQYVDKDAECYNEKDRDGYCEPEKKVGDKTPRCRFDLSGVYEFDDYNKGRYDKNSDNFLIENRPNMTTICQYPTTKISKDQSDLIYLAAFRYALDPLPKAVEKLLAGRKLATYPGWPNPPKKPARKEATVDYVNKKDIAGYRLANICWTTNTKKGWPARDRKSIDAIGDLDGNTCEMWLIENPDLDKQMDAKTLNVTARSYLLNGWYWTKDRAESVKKGNNLTFKGYNEYVKDKTRDEFKGGVTMNFGWLEGVFSDDGDDDGDDNGDNDGGDDSETTSGSDAGEQGNDDNNDAPENRIDEATNESLQKCRAELRNNKEELKRLKNKASYTSEEQSKASCASISKDKKDIVNKRVAQYAGKMGLSAPTFLEKGDWIVFEYKGTGGVEACRKIEILKKAYEDVLNCDVRLAGDCSDDKEKQP